MKIDLPQVVYVHGRPCRRRQNSVETLVRFTPREIPDVSANEVEIGTIRCPRDRFDHGTTIHRVDFAVWNGRRYFPMVGPSAVSSYDNAKPIGLSLPVWQEALRLAHDDTPLPKSKGYRVPISQGLAMSYDNARHVLARLTFGLADTPEVKMPFQHIFAIEEAEGEALATGLANDLLSVDNQIFSARHEPIQEHTIFEDNRVAARTDVQFGTATDSRFLVAAFKPSPPTTIILATLDGDYFQTGLSVEDPAAGIPWNAEVTSANLEMAILDMWALSLDQPAHLTDGLDKSILAILHDIRSGNPDLDTTGKIMEINATIRSLAPSYRDSFADNTLATRIDFVRRMNEGPLALTP